ncbi:ABC transporter substrate-binding protein [Bradyrhizobium jicamae]|uniref:ABC transporter substrate-binding protein n=1 Tax=Bradyrhizobium jicamae TaxID=280332 RepID=UPI001BA560B4|nr:ABC transporter substrate-binding protein [Bradyrhizobium jicamae]MBR0937307.1 ABC transporter substrate-binding protein [Bradyrhizobium jicamae]
MRRRTFIALLGGAAAAWPIVGRAQRSALPVIGVLGFGTKIQDRFHAFATGLEKAGYIDRQNVVIDYRGGTTPGQWREILSDFDRQKVTVIVASNGGPAVQARHATTTIPVVFVNIGLDPVKLGLVESLNRPGGNVTGVAFFGTELAAKRLDLLCQAVPSATTVAYLSGGRWFWSFEEEKKRLTAAADALRRQLIVIEYRTDAQLEAALATFAENAAGALMLGSEPTFFDPAFAEKIVTLTERYKIPAIYTSRQFALRGGLMSYGDDYADNLIAAADLVGKILAGIKPADLPVRMSTKFDFVVNLKTAKQLGLEIPQSLLAFANDVIG